MGINLVSLASQFLTSDLIAKIASALGSDRGSVGKAATALVPALLGSFANVAATPSGAQKLVDAVNQQNLGILDSLASAIGGQGQQALVSGGLRSLNSLLGRTAVPALASAVGKFAGIGERRSSSLIGMLAPAVLGVIGKQQSAQGLDASGLAQLLLAQKANITAGLPSGLSNLLQSSGFPSIAGSGRQATRTAGAAMSNEVQAAQTAAPKDWAKWLLPLLALAGIALWAFGSRPNDEVDRVKSTAGQVVENFTVDGVDLRSTIQTALDGLKATLQGVNDAASVMAAWPKLETEAAKLERARELSAKLSVERRSVLANLVSTARPSVEELLMTVLASTGADPPAKSAVKAMQAIEALAKKPIT